MPIVIPVLNLGKGIWYNWLESLEEFDKPASSVRFVRAMELSGSFNFSFSI